MKRADQQNQSDGMDVCACFNSDYPDNADVVISKRTFQKR